MAAVAKVTGTAQAGPAEPTKDELKRENRELRAILQELEERRQGPTDAEGIWGKAALLIGRDKNLAHLLREIDWLPSAVHAHHPLYPDGPEAGFWAAVEGATINVSAAVATVAAFDPQHPYVVRDLHRLLDMWLSPPPGHVLKLLRPDFQGFSERLKLKKAIVSIVYGYAVRWVSATAHEAPSLPIEAERKGYPS